MQEIRPVLIILHVPDPIHDARCRSIQTQETITSLFISQLSNRESFVA